MKLLEKFKECELSDGEVYEKKRQSDFAIFLFIIAISLLVLYSAFAFTKKVSNDLTYTKSTTATVNSYETYSNTSGFIFVITNIERTIFCTYVVNGIEYKNGYDVDFPYQEGDVVNIKYDLDNISNSILDVK